MPILVNNLPAPVTAEFSTLPPGEIFFLNGKAHVKGTGGAFNLVDFVWNGAIPNNTVVTPAAGEIESPD